MPTLRASQHHCLTVCLCPLRAYSWRISRTRGERRSRRSQKTQPRVRRTVWRSTVR